MVRFQLSDSAAYLEGGEGRESLNKRSYQNDPRD